ncbi:MAG TPA: molecular chaperone DnaJ [Egibacteraceae bacterium]|nr:molecular chaperone DnaJ [Egibacteraceae bacterium]
MAQRDYFEKDYYATLGVSKDATQAEISKAYRKLARELHPDARPDDPRAESRFKEVSEAHSVLSNPDKRKEYDEVREMVGSGAFFQGGRGDFPGGGFPGGGFPGGDSSQVFDLGDLLGGLFGQGGAPGGSPFAGTRTTRRGTGPQRGRDVETDLRLSFGDAMAGVTTTLRVTGQASCSTCFGSGARPGTSPVQCPTCNGTGSVTQDQGLFGFSEPCPSCHGRGVQIPDPCPTCRGSGVEQRVRDIRARIPAGVRDGARIRLKGRGEAGLHGGPPGDLYVRVHVESDPLFGRQGDNLTLRVPITFAEAALGTKLRVPTLEGPVTLRIPAGTESGRTFRVKGRGVPKSGGGRGDLLVTVDVVVPRKLTRTQRKLLEEFAETEDAGVRDHLEAAMSTGVG